jgi:hypothetical protein
LKDTLGDWLKKEKSSDEEYKAFSMEKPTQKSVLKGSAPLPTIRERYGSLTSLGGALQLSVHPFEGALACLRESLTVEENQGEIPLISGVS